MSFREITASAGHSRKRVQPPRRGGQERVVRGSYVSKACQSCRRRKTKCNGELPCGRCSADGKSCSYTPTCRQRSPERSAGRSRMAMQLSHAEDQSHTVTRQVITPEESGNNLTSPKENDQHDYSITENHLATSHQALSIPAPFRGPTSAEFAFELATRSLQSRIATAEFSYTAGLNKADSVLSALSESPAHPSPLAKMILTDPLQGMDVRQAKRLVKAYQSGPGAINPIVNTAESLQTCEATFVLLKVARRTGSVRDMAIAIEQLTSPAVITLKLVLANAATLNCRGNFDQTRTLFASVRSILEGYFWAQPDLRMVQHWILAAILHYQLDEEFQASRLAAHAVRLCLELGINRMATLRRCYPDSADRTLAAKLVWTAFTLDRRSSIGMGIPHSIMVGDMDVTLSTTDEETLYLKSMVALSCISGDVYQFTNQLIDKHAPISTVRMDHLEFQIVQWQKSLDHTFMLSRADWQKSHELHDLTTAQLLRRFVLVLRANHLLMLIHKPVLHTSERTVAHDHHARTAIQISCDTLNLLSDLSIHNEKILHNNGLRFKYFLISAFSILMLAIANSPEIIASLRNDTTSSFSDSIHTEFHMAVSLFRLLGSFSPAMSKWWKAVQALQSLVFSTSFAEKAPVAEDSSWEPAVRVPQEHPQRPVPEVQQQQESAFWPRSDDQITDNDSDFHFDTQLSDELNAMLEDSGLFSADLYASILDPLGLEYGVSNTQRS